MNIQMNKREEGVNANICMNEWIYWIGRTKINKEWIKGKNRFVDSIVLYKLEICLETKHVQIELRFSIGGNSHKWVKDLFNSGLST